MTARRNNRAAMRDLDGLIDGCNKCRLSVEWVKGTVVGGDGIGC